MPQRFLKKYFGYETFRPLQKEAIDAILNKKDTLVVLPTGGGKSLIYQIPAVMQKGVALVFSPLISLMKDQVDTLNKMGIYSAYLNSTLTDSQKKEICLNAKTGSLKLLYIAPEGFFSNSFQEFIKTLNISLIAIDEAHCISEWGHDFRPEYRKLSILKKILPQKPIIALTATATKQVQKDIIKQLKSKEMNAMVGSFKRENLSIYVYKKNNLTEQIVNILKKRKKESGIIYCSTRKKVEELSEFLNNMGYFNLSYHGGMERKERTKNQEDYLNEKVNLMVATVAFGMGIDKSNIRYIIHADLPKSIESYYQEIGRAGRDGLPSNCYLFYSNGDVATQQFLIDKSENQNYKQIAFDKLQEMLKYVRTVDCRHKYIINYFGQKEKDYSCKRRCDICSATDVREKDISVEAQKILSCLFRVQKPIGVSVLAGILGGSKSKKVNFYKDLSTYGLMSDFSQDNIKSLIYSLVDQGYLIQEAGKYPVLYFGKEARKVLTGKKKVIVRSRVVKEREDIADYEVELLDLLKSWRFKEAKKEKVPPYIIFSDKVLIDMAMYLPFKIQDLKEIPGIGDEKLKIYGKILLESVKKYCNKRNLKSKIEDLKIKKEVNKAKNSRITETVSKTYFYYKQKMGIKEIAEKRGLVSSTISGHILKLMSVGKIEKEDVYNFVEKKKVKIIKDKIMELGVSNISLTPIKEALGDDFSYEDIRFVRGIMG